MEEELKTLLTEHFEELKNYHQILIIGANSLVALFSLGIGLWTNYKLIKIKAKQDLLSKKFEKYHDLQISAVKLIYPLIVKLDFSSEQLQNPLINGDSKIEIAERINAWISSFNELSVTYYQSDLYFDDEISQLIHKYINTHKSLFFSFSKNREAIEEHQVAKSDEFPSEEIISYTREDLIKSADELRKVKSEFTKSNPEIREFMKEKFKLMLNPKE